MTSLVNPIPLVLVIATTFGVLMHDTKVDKLATAAIANPSLHSAYGASEVARTNEHVHVEKVSVGGQAHANTARFINPRTQVRDDDHRYVQAKKSPHNGGDSNGLWPSI
jgi:hypothetical protein